MNTKQQKNALQKKSKNIVKIVFEDEVRKYRDINSYNDLILAIARTLGYGVLNWRFVYVDDDEDEITVSNEDDLQEAFNFFGDKPPRLTLVTYDEKVDISLSNVRLCDSMLSREAEEELNEIAGSNNSSVIEDRPMQIVTESSLKRPPKEQSVVSMEPSLNISEFQQPEIVPENSDKYEVFSNHENDENRDDEIQEIDEHRIQPIVIEDRIKPAEIKEEPKVEEKVAEEIKEENCEKLENRPRIMDQNAINIVDFQSKVSELVKVELQNLLPELLKQTKLDFETLKFEQELIRYKDVVHEGVSCDVWKIESIRGIRYKCAICENFDMCANCENKSNHKHPVMKITSPKKYRAFLKELAKH